MDIENQLLNLVQLGSDLRAKQQRAKKSPSSLTQHAASMAERAFDVAIAEYYMKRPAPKKKVNQGSMDFKFLAR